MTPSRDGGLVDTREVAAWHAPDLRTVAAPHSAELGPTPEEAAYQRGWDDGQAELRGTESASHAAQVAALAAVERALSDAAGLLQARFVESVNALSIGIARHVVGAQFEIDPSHIAALVSRALALAPLGGPITIRLNPVDLESISGLPAVHEPVSPTLDLRWVGDASIVRGGCVLEGPTSVVDGRIDRVMLDIYERLSND